MCFDVCTVKRNQSTSYKMCCELQMLVFFFNSLVVMSCCCSFFFGFVLFFIFFNLNKDNIRTRNFTNMRRIKKG